MAYVDDVNLLGDNIDILNKNTHTKKGKSQGVLVRKRTIPTERTTIVGEF
jgi:hypothetical protein